ncbi:hypothetical protein TL16_g09194 [Triparma laevis f. inornata]|uniref:Uncharacterized protein n=1 Tax=Triparma laevis f. inornata TaxID=1714386 RepID=A0A9W7B539_9STRA|nr:hypothetical protein TL16_g09194 [Triparma laevis f. inornata]
MRDLILLFLLPLLLPSTFSTESTGTTLIQLPTSSSFTLACDSRSSSMPYASNPLSNKLHLLTSSDYGGGEWWCLTFLRSGNTRSTTDLVSELKESIKSILTKRELSKNVPSTLTPNDVISLLHSTLQDYSSKSCGLLVSYTGSTNLNLEIKNLNGRYAILDYGDDCIVAGSGGSLAFGVLKSTLKLEGGGGYLDCLKNVDSEEKNNIRASIEGVLESIDGDYGSGGICRVVSIKKEGGKGWVREILVRRGEEGEAEVFDFREGYR